MSSNTVEKESMEHKHNVTHMRFASFSVQKMSSFSMQKIQRSLSRNISISNWLDTVKPYVTTKGLEKMLEATSFITAFLGAMFFSTMCNYTYEEYRAADERISRFENISVWITTFGYWSVSLFYLSLVISLVLYVDLVTYIYDGDTGNDQLSAEAWFLANYFWLFFLAGITLIGLLLGVWFSFLMGFLIMNKDQSNTFGWRVAGYVFVLTIIVLLVQIIYFHYSGKIEEMYRNDRAKTVQAKANRARPKEKSSRSNQKSQNDAKVVPMEDGR